MLHSIITLNSSKTNATYLTTIIPIPTAQLKSYHNYQPPDSSIHSANMHLSTLILLLTAGVASAKTCWAGGIICECKYITVLYTIQRYTNTHTN